MFPFDVPTYVQGYRFSDESDDFYDPVSKRFRDLAGYGPAADLRITAGNPVFATVGGHRGVTIDNTFRGLFPNPIPWMGSMLLVAKPEYVSGATLVRFPIRFGDSAAPNYTNDGALWLWHFSGQRSLVLTGGGAQASAFLTRNDNNLVVAAFSRDQNSRKAYATHDGATITEVNGPVSTTNGLGIALNSSMFGARFGELGTDWADLTPITDFYLRIFEMHFFAGSILSDHLTEAAAMIAGLRAKYGVV